MCSVLTSTADFFTRENAFFKNSEVDRTPQVYITSVSFDKLVLAIFVIFALVSFPYYVVMAVNLVTGF